MSGTGHFRIVLIKPSKYRRDGYVERFRRGFMPNSTLLHLRSLSPTRLGGRPVEVEVFDEHVTTDLGYLHRLHPDRCDLLALVGVQSHQMHRALDLAALAVSRGVRNCVVGGPHPMTCDTVQAQGRGVSFAVAEAELVWPAILDDARSGELRPLYGGERRWQRELDPPVLEPPDRSALGRYVIPMVGLYPARGCPYHCNFCSVVKIAGKTVRSQSVETTLESLRRARRAGVRLVMFTSDNFNKYGEARTLLQAMIDHRIDLPFFVQCDVQLGRDEELVALLARAGCAQVFLGAESFDRGTLKSVGKMQNQPVRYEELVRLCHGHGVTTHFSNIFGFPEQDEAGILEHLDALRGVRPFMASFYILTPIPGTDQYDDFRARGWIEEGNLDRFDATCCVWRHPTLSASRLEALLMRAYREFYSLRDVVGKMFGRRWNAPWFVHRLGLGYAAFARFAVGRGMHPMAGGFGLVRRDRVDDYLPLRRRVFGFDHLALPDSLALAHDEDRRLYHGRRGGAG